MKKYKPSEAIENRIAQNWFAACHGHAHSSSSGSLSRYGYVRIMFCMWLVLHIFALWWVGNLSIDIKSYHLVSSGIIWHLGLAFLNPVLTSLDCA